MTADECTGMQGPQMSADEYAGGGLLAV